MKRKGKDQKISYHDEIASAHLACKTVEYLPEIPLHVLFLTIRDNLPKGSGAVSVPDVVNTIGNQADELGIQYVYAFGKTKSNIKVKLRQSRNQGFLARKYKSIKTEEKQ